MLEREKDGDDNDDSNDDENDDNDKDDSENNGGGAGTQQSTCGNKRTTGPWSHHCHFSSS